MVAILDIDSILLVQTELMVQASINSNPLPRQTWLLKRVVP